MDKEVSSALTTVYEPDLPWNKWKREPKGKDPGEERPVAERLTVEIEWPTLEDSSRYAEAGSTTAISFAYVKRCVKFIKNSEIAGVTAKNGAELAAVPAHKNRKAWQLVLNVGSHIFAACYLSGDDEKN